MPSGRRYATFLVPSIAAIVGWAFKRLWLAGAVTILLAATWTTATVWDASNGLASVRHPAVGEPIATLARRLEHMHRTDVWADYWISYLLSAASQERILAADLSLRREESYLNSARNAARTTVVVFPDGENQQTLRALPHLPPHKAVPVGPYVVWAFSTHVDVDRHLFSTD